MEQLNSNLYAKYNNLKKSKALVDEEWNRKREADISDFQSAVEVVEYLKNENDRLREEMYSLLDQYEDCKELMLEECQKTKQLSEEVERLQNCSTKKITHSDTASQRTPHTSPRVTRSKTKAKGSPEKVERLQNHSLKRSANSDTASPRVTRSRTEGSTSKLASLPVTMQNEVQNKELAIVPRDNNQIKVVVPDCCRRSTTNSGEAAGEDQGRCVFQTLFELLLGMEFSVDIRSEGPCLQAVHQMSGYTFMLMWMRREDGESQFRYHVSSLGTLERVALEWMKEDIVFSMTMWPVFFEKISRVIGRC